MSLARPGQVACRLVLVAVVALCGGNVALGAGAPRAITFCKSGTSVIWVGAFGAIHTWDLETDVIKRVASPLTNQWANFAAVGQECKFALVGAYLSDLKPRLWLVELEHGRARRLRVPNSEPAATLDAVFIDDAKDLSIWVSSTPGVFVQWRRVSDGKLVARSGTGENTRIAQGSARISSGGVVVLSDIEGQLCAFAPDQPAACARAPIRGPGDRVLCVDFRDERFIATFLKQAAKIVYLTGRPLAVERTGPGGFGLLTADRALVGQWGHLRDFGASGETMADFHYPGQGPLEVGSATPSGRLVAVGSRTGEVAVFDLEERVWLAVSAADGKVTRWAPRRRPPSPTPTERSPRR